MTAQTCELTSLRTPPDIDRLAKAPIPQQAQLLLPTAFENAGIIYDADSLESAEIVDNPHQEIQFNKLLIILEKITGQSRDMLLADGCVLGLKNNSQALESAILSFSSLLEQLQADLEQQQTIRMDALLAAFTEAFHGKVDTLMQASKDPEVLWRMADTVLKQTTGMPLKDLTPAEREAVYGVEFNSPKNISTRLQIAQELQTVQLGVTAQAYFLHSPDGASTADHMVQTLSIADIVAETLPLKQQKNFGIYVLLHDIGKLLSAIVPQNVPFNKLPDRLQLLMRSHSSSDNSYINLAAEPRARFIAVQHHPTAEGAEVAVADKETQLYTALTIVIDILDAMLSKRPYRNEFLTSFAAMAEILKTITKFDLQGELKETVIRTVTHILHHEQFTAAYASATDRSERGFAKLVEKEELVISREFGVSRTQLADILTEAVTLHKKPLASIETIQASANKLQALLKATTAETPIPTQETLAELLKTMANRLKELDIYVKSGSGPELATIKECCNIHSLLPETALQALNQLTYPQIQLTLRIVDRTIAEERRHKDEPPVVVTQTDCDAIMGAMGQYFTETQIIALQKLAPKNESEVSSASVTALSPTAISQTELKVREG